MSDLFQEGIPDAYVGAVANVMLAANWHTYQVLTKRADRMRELLSGPLRAAASAKHIWWGVSVEDKRYGLPRIKALRAAPASVRFLSVEPLLEDLGNFDLGGIDWMIVGGESGPGARAMSPSWVERLRLQCKAEDVAFFFKQWGGVQKSKAGRELNGRTYDAMPQRVSNVVPSAAERDRLAVEVESRALTWSSEPIVQLRRGRRQTAQVDLP
jgi:protein gp37